MDRIIDPRAKSYLVDDVKSGRLTIEPGVGVYGGFLCHLYLRRFCAIGPHSCGCFQTCPTSSINQILEGKLTWSQYGDTHDSI